MKFYLLLITAIFCQHHGSEDDCGEYFTPPSPLFFELIDKETGENLFTNGTYDADQIEVTNSLDNSSIGFTFIDE